MRTTQRKQLEQSSLSEVKLVIGLLSRVIDVQIYVR
jgi:hypothetical protein